MRLKTSALPWGIAWLGLWLAAHAHAQAWPPMAAAESTAPRTAPAEPPLHLQWVEVSINQTPVGAWTLLERSGELHATPEILSQWRLLVPARADGIEFRGATWLPLHALPGYRARFDFSNQSLQLEFAPEAFTTTRMKPVATQSIPLSKVAPALFFNYDLSHTRASGAGAASSQSTGALTEIGLSTAAGTLISSQLARNIGSSDPNLPSEWRRLETTWTRDFQDRQLTLRLGDTATRATLWGRNLYFGGLQLGSNFGLTPGFLSQPIPSLAGTATSPGTVELYVNNALRQVSNIPAGPFTVENFMPITGAGEARVVVRDVLGRESVMVSPFFSSSQLLEQGLSDWSLNLGKQRYNLGTLSADYRDAFASGLYRQGISKGLTLEGRAEWSRPLQTLGLGLNAQLPWLALGQAALATSRDASDVRGSKLLLGLDHQDLSNGFNARWVQASRNYRELGFSPTELPYKAEHALSWRHTFDDKASATLSWAQLTSHEQGASRVMSASYALRVGQHGTLIFSGTQVSGMQTGRTLGLSLVLPLDRQRVATAALSKTPTGWDGYAAATEPVGLETGLGWRVLAGRRAEQDHGEAGVYYQGSRGFLGADVAASGATQTLRLNAQGAAVLMEGHLFAARRLQEGFALVQVPGYPNVGVGFQGETIARTDREGFAMLPRLAAYQTNTIRLQASDLPMSAELDNIETTAVPAWRSGVSVKFPVRSGRGALVKIVLPDGTPVPPGAHARLLGDDKDFVVARRGEVFLTGLQPRNTVVLRWADQACQFVLDLPAVVDDTIARIGPLVCEGLSP